MARRTRSLRDLRAEAEAAEALGLNNPPARKPRAESNTPALKPKPAPQARMRVVWAVCDIGGRTVATFEYPRKADAEAHAAALKAKGKGNHFVRSIKEMMG